MEHRIGRAPLHAGGPATSWIVLDVRLDADRLAISGGWGGNGPGAVWGQIQDHVREALDAGEITFANGWDADRLRHLLDVWDRWHLNDMRAGCEHQRAMGWTSYEAHPSESCPVCGYEYGSAWLTEPLPDDVREWVASLEGVEVDVIDTWSSASRQHYIDTGQYLAAGEEGVEES